MEKTNKGFSSELFAIPGGLWKECQKSPNALLGFVQFCLGMGIVFVGIGASIGLPVWAIGYGSTLLLWPEYRYATLYNVSTDNVFVDPEPTDCEFMTAPLGDKHCHTRKDVTKYEGKVYVSWTIETDAQQKERETAEKMERQQERERRAEETRPARPFDPNAPYSVVPENVPPEPVSDTDSLGNHCLPHQRAENAQGQFVCVPPLPPGYTLSPPQQVSQP
jgi:hypothetical protein